MNDDDLTIVRAMGASVRAPPARAAAGSGAAADPDATVRRAPPHDPDATLRRAPPPDPDATVRKPAPPVVHRVDPDATVIRRTVLRAQPATPQPPVLPPGVARALPARTQALPGGLTLQEYRIERVLGQGGFGITYLATDTHLKSQVAIKEYLPAEIAFRAGDRSVSPNASVHRDRYTQGLVSFLAEARTLASLRHPHIVRVARFFEAHRTAYMVLEYERGQSLRQWWPEQAARHPQPERLLVERLQPLLDGLATVHAAGYLHRDIKPDNIQVRDDDGRFVLLDFGSAGQAVALADQEAVVVTPGYAPVEQYGLGEQGAWTDVYALGATLYWAVSGDKPPDAESRSAGVALRPAVEAGAGRYGRAFLEAIDWALQMDPAARPPGIEAWRARLLADHAGSLGLSEALRHEESRLQQAARRMLSPAAWPLALKLALAMLATALLPMLATGLYNLAGAQSALEQAQLGKSELIAHNTAGRIGQLLAGRAQLARGLAADAAVAPWLAAPDPDAAAPLLQRLQGMAAANPDLQFLMLMDTAGTVRLSTDPELTGRSFAFRDYFRQAAAGRPHVTGLIVGAAAGQAGVFFAEPVRDAAGAVAGVVVLRLRGNAVAAILAEVRHDGGLLPFMVDGDGVVVQHPQPERLYRSLQPLAEPVQARLRADQRFRRDRIDSLGEAELATALAAQRGGGHAAYRSAVDGNEQIAGFAPVPGHDWTVVVAQPREAFEQPLAQLRLHLLLSLALAGLLFTALALRFARGIVRPVRALTAGTDALRAGRFDEARVTVTARDELGQLARTFNVMVDVLRQRELERGRQRDSTRDG
jgi:serine/threonine protein kinase/HAMP domain-containing protein